LLLLYLPSSPLQDYPLFHKLEVEPLDLHLKFEFLDFVAVAAMSGGERCSNIGEERSDKMKKGASEASAYD